ncbi:hypothetical protein OIU79_022946 [Salix purpurea]|uniref:Uncharacterized protein n=1 Tax=Salix purpurea TaxID=77065 RepID=A0A9Q0WJM8_SALPP|nr:hypothetical protein OIU79_022946 [Salix purpurea]
MCLQYCISIHSYREMRRKVFWEQQQTKHHRAHMVSWGNLVRHGCCCH